jgi:hypothetical protein
MRFGRGGLFICTSAPTSTLTQPLQWPSSIQAGKFAQTASTDLALRCQGWITVSFSNILFSAALTADRNIHECTVENLASGDGGGCFQPVVHFLSAAQRFLHVFADVLGADEVRKFGLLDEL